MSNIMFCARVTVLAVLAAIASCGPVLRISNGSEAPIEEMPFLGSVSTVSGEQHCGGAILTSYYVMTAAHCVRPNLQCRVGTSSRSSGGRLFDVLTVTIHDDYNGSPNADIAVLGLANPIVFDNPGVMQAPLPFQDMPVVEGVFGFIAGWGFDQTSGSPPEHFKFGQVLITSQESCAVAHQNVSIDNSIVCASSATASVVDLCPGDTGGPLISSGMVTGVAVRGSCAAEDLPSLYTNVARYSDWIAVVASGVPNGAQGPNGRSSSGVQLEVKRT